MRDQFSPECAGRARPAEVDPLSGTTGPGFLSGQTLIPAQHRRVNEATHFLAGHPLPLTDVPVLYLDGACCPVTMPYSRPSRIEGGKRTQPRRMHRPRCGMVRCLDAMVDEMDAVAELVTGKANYFDDKGTTRNR